MILNKQRSVRVSIRPLREFFARALAEVKLADNAASVCLVTDAQIAKWNTEYRGKPKPTDVLSFPAEGTLARRVKRGKGAYLGDIAIAPAVARRNARIYGRTFDQEMRILILHGILHLMGYDHETDTGQMERREKRLRRTLGIS
jgi:probable rRNA maturation factor